MYSYDELKPTLFTDEGQRMFLRIRDHAKDLLAKAGAARMDRIILGAGPGDSWLMIACVDRLVELGEIEAVTQPAVMGQDRIFVSARR